MEYYSAMRRNTLQLTIIMSYKSSRPTEYILYVFIYVKYKNRKNYQWLKSEQWLRPLGQRSPGFLTQGSGAPMRI